ncbi:ficolin-1-like isoform X2 [Ostrea edulis]|nr:ficolin-1-like isoform X2 [Ostrea edulis]
MEISGGGWTVIQNRFDGSVDFDRDWVTYKNGFGTSTGEYWIGNDVIHELTKANTSSLYVSITLTNGTTLFEQYEKFSVTSERDNYRLFIAGQATGTLGDSIIKREKAGDIINGMMFTTSDRDNDKNPRNNCGREHSGGWWFNYCHDAYLNGVYGSSSWMQPWTPTLPLGTLIRKTMMMLKRLKPEGF